MRMGVGCTVDCPAAREIDAEIKRWEQEYPKRARIANLFVFTFPLLALIGCFDCAYALVSGSNEVLDRFILRLACYVATFVAFCWIHQKLISK